MTTNAAIPTTTARTTATSNFVTTTDDTATSTIESEPEPSNAAAAPAVNQAAIIGGAVGCGVLLIGLVALVACLVRRRATKSQSARFSGSARPQYGAVPAANPSEYEVGQLKQVQAEEYASGNVS